MSRFRLIGAGALLAAASLQMAAAQPAGDNRWAAVNGDSLSAAIHNIEAQGGRVLEIRFHQSADGGPHYDAVVAHGDQISRVTAGLRPEDQVVTFSEQVMPTWMSGFALKADQRSLRQAKIPLASAVAMADQMLGGSAVDAGIAKPLGGDNSVLAYNIEVIKNGVPIRVAIDAVTGQQIADPDTVLGAWTPERSFRNAFNQG